MKELRGGGHAPAREKECIIDNRLVVTEMMQQTGRA